MSSSRKCWWTWMARTCPQRSKDFKLRCFSDLTSTVLGSWAHFGLVSFTIHYSCGLRRKPNKQTLEMDLALSIATFIMCELADSSWELLLEGWSIWWRKLLLALAIFFCIKIAYHYLCCICQWRGMSKTTHITAFMNWVVTDKSLYFVPQWQKVVTGQSFLWKCLLLAKGLVFLLGLTFFQ